MITIRKSRPSDLSALIDIWRSSVRATHGFLSEAHFREIETVVSEAYLPHADLWVAADGEDRPVGFMGMTGAHVDALFVGAEQRGKGIGRMLLAHAERLFPGLTVDVNEQNLQAVGFYHRMGFTETGRSPTDDEGRPYPLLHLRKG
ncbi:acetyltransferase [Indioceanicola profundi]|uniref:acetyltransferase n=1 Tax=Indioceanicola profundi TaxID=2220096 RepID=UPI000E6A993F|nr:acetyltransferase [Indioceanicola profundi]